MKSSYYDLFFQIQKYDMIFPIAYPCKRCSFISTDLKVISKHRVHCDRCYLKKLE